MRLGERFFVSRQKTFQILLLGIWFGVVTGLLQAAVLAVRRFGYGQWVGHGPEIFWIAPLMGLVLFGVVGSILSLLAWYWPRRVPLRLCIFLYVFLASFSVLLMFSQLFRIAQVLLAAGLATAISSFLAPRVQRFEPTRRRTLRAMLGLIAAGALGSYGWRRFSEVRALAQLPPARADAPNVLLIVLDTVRAPSLSLYGYPRQTSPQLQRFSRQGVCFTRALSTAPWTLASHASMFTGRFPHELSADWLVPLDSTFPTLAQFLGAHGYETAGFVSNVRYCSYEHGLNRGFVHYEDYSISLERAVASSPLANYLLSVPPVLRRIGNGEFPRRKSAAELNRAFLSWLSRREQRPFFAFLNYFDAHAPYLAPSPFDRMFGPKRASGWDRLQPTSKIPPEILQGMVDSYDGTLAYLDSQLGLLLEELGRRGVLENTLIIITSDHGEEFGEHGLLDHGSTLFMPSVHVPLVVHFPGQVPQKQVIRTPISLRNLAATVVDMLNLRDDSPFPGQSLARCWASPSHLKATPLLAEVRRAPGMPDWIPVGKGDMRSLLMDQWRYILDGEGNEQLYAIKDDPWELSDLSRSDEGSRLLPRFRDCLESMLARGNASGWF
jgi:arylsulfatase A-like enzyme